MSDTRNAGRISWNPWRWPLYARVVLGVVIGTLLGVQFGTAPFLWGMSTKELGQLGLLIIRLLTALATPLILFAILDAFVHTHISGRLGLKMVVICLINIAIAFVIGLTIMNTWEPGRQWQGQLESLAEAVQAGNATGHAPGGSLSPIQMLDRYIPPNVLQPFQESNLLSVVLLAVLAGVAFRQVRRKQQAAQQTSYRAVENFIITGYQMLLRVLAWMIELVPLAVLGSVAKVVGESGSRAFLLLWVFLMAILLGLAMHALLYYPLSAWLIGGKSPRVYLGRGADAVLTGLSTNSSLASVPVTLICLKRMNVSPESSRLSACVGTNFNNDGITLYEAMSVLFIAQAAGYNLNLGQQVAVLLMALFATVGVAGIPGSGMIILPLVMQAAGLPAEVIGVAYPMLQSIDWVIARIRSGVNVLGDMQVAILLDAGRQPDELAPLAAAGDEVEESSPVGAER